MIKSIRFLGYKFDSMNEFKRVQDLAKMNCSNSIDEFKKFLDCYYSK